MRLVVDVEQCIAAGQCVVTAAEVFDQDEETGVVVVRASVSDAAGDLRPDVREAVLLCPSGALSLTGGAGEAPHLRTLWRETSE